MKCKTCGVGDSIAFCSETGAPICAKCAVSCDVCESPLSRERVQFSSTGRKLCSKCMAERNARRKAQKEQMRREKAEREKPRPSSPAPAATAGLGGGISFEDLMRDEPALAANLQSVKREEAPRAPEPQPEDAPESAGTSFEDLMSSGPAAPGTEKPKRRAGLEGVPQEGSKRLELGPIDEHRPILTASGHQGPGKMAYTAAFLLFGLAGVIFFTVMPGIREIMLPGQSVGANFTTDLMPVATDTNALRNTSNISQFDLLSQGPVFLIAWSIVLIYTLGFVLILWSVGRSLLETYLAKRRLKKAEEYAKKHGISYPQ